MLKLKKFRLFAKAFIAVLVILILKYITDRYGLSFVVVNTLTGSFFGGVFFTITIIFTGAMTDYKEAEKIPGELAILLKAFRNDAMLVTHNIQDIKLKNKIFQHIEQLLYAINSNFRNNYWHKSALDELINLLDDDLYELHQINVAPTYIIKMRDYLTSIDRISHRIDCISKTSVIPGANMIASVALVAVLLVFVFTKNEWGIGGIILFASITFILSSIMLLIFDMEHPFEYEKGTLAYVDLGVIMRLEAYWKKNHTQCISDL